MIRDHAALNPGDSTALKKSIESISKEARRLINARLLNAEEAEAIAIFIRDMRDRLKLLEDAEAGSVDIVKNVNVAYYELEGMVKMLRGDLEIAQTRTSA